MFSNSVKNKGDKKELDLFDKGIEDKDIPEICAFIEEYKITSLDVGCNNIGAEGAGALAQTTLTSLSVRYNKIGTEGARAFTQNATLTSLNVRGNNIGDEGANALAQNTTLTSLDVGGKNNLSDAGKNVLKAAGPDSVQQCNNDIKAGKQVNAPTLKNLCIWVAKKEENNPRLKKVGLPLELIEAINKPTLKVRF